MNTRFLTLFCLFALVATTQAGWIYNGDPSTWEGGWFRDGEGGGVSGADLLIGITEEDAYRGDWGRDLSNRVDALSYVTPTVSLTGGGAYVKGQTVANPALTFTCSKTMTARNLTGAATAALGAGGSGTYTDTGRNLTKDSATKTYTLTVTDGVHTNASTTTYSWTNRRYVGQSTNSAAWENAEIIGMTASTQAKGASGTAVTLEAEYIVIAYPASLGACTSFSLGGFSTTAWPVTTNDIENAYAFSESYLIYRTENPLTTGSIAYDID